MYFQARNHYSFLLSDNLRQKSYLLWLKCTAFSTALLLQLRIRLCTDWWDVGVFWTAICIGVSRTSVGFEGKGWGGKERKSYLWGNVIFVSFKLLNLLSLTPSTVLI
jgi:hypothetical protein